MRHILFIIGALATTLLMSSRAPQKISLEPAKGPTLSDTVAPLSFKGVENAVVGLYIENIATGEVLAEFGADRPMCPASIMKAVTSASVLSLYAPDRCFATRVSCTGEITEGTLHGDIVIAASGDPTLGSAYFDGPDSMTDSIVSALLAAGIDSITGTIRIDSSAIPDASYPPGWGDDDYMWPYGAMLRAFNWRDNRYTLTLPSKNTSPYIPGLRVDFRRQKQGRMGYDSKPPLTLVKAWGRPASKGSSIDLAMPSPSEAFLYSLKSSLVASGITLGEGKAENVGPIWQLTEVLSPSFREILRSLMFRSDNLFAEGMLRTIAPMQPRDSATTRELTLWSLRGADTDSVVIIDGSGLSRLNRLTPWFLADVLSWMARSPMAADYAASFPKVGREGTVKRFLAGSRLEGRLALKTGTMRGVRALAGYMLDDNGMPTHTVVLIVNRFSCSPSVVNKSAESFFLSFFS
ncbi:MAG: D-alanyl-D-alanine carboxypeptidase/D-alanyl-D-alanine-endopeptidase [Bacteroides sp.]|nr:D-alanyl-D-alanine carboxypeptidase/D-alanyl-D-alanine-endopeptidase [Bacteroides sp.]